ncbi:MAG: SixA phosphatase family protein [Chitinophagaceae bacterium]
MERTIILIRHAKSSWADPDMSDFDRPLNERGKRDVPVMAARLLNRGIHPGLLVSSTAKRAASTARGFAAVLNYPEPAIAWKPELYLPEPDVFASVIKQLPDTAKTIAIFSHNPGVTYFSNRLSGVRIDDMPTCSMVAARINLSSWKDFEERSTKFWFFDAPKHPFFS